MTDRDRIVRKVSQKRDAARARLLTQHRKLAQVKKRNEQRANAKRQHAGSNQPDTTTESEQTPRRSSSNDDVPGSWSSVPERVPTRDDTPTAPHRPRLYGHRLRRRANRTEDDE